MGKNSQPNCRRSAKRRTLPDDAASIEAAFRSIHQELARRAKHLKKNSHETEARRGLPYLHAMRSVAWAKLYWLAPPRALRLAAEFNLKVPPVTGGES